MDLTVSANIDSILGAADYAAIRTLLGLTVGTNVQAYDADLTTWAGVTPGTGVAAFLTTPSSANLAAAVTGETGTGALVFADSPTFAGVPLAPTATSGTSTTQVATTAFVMAAVTTWGNIVTDATTARTIGLSDAGKYIRFTNAGAITLTIPTNAVTAFPVGTEIVVRRHTGAGAITLSNAGVTVNNSALAPTIAAEGNFALKKVATDTWDVI